MLAVPPVFGLYFPAAHNVGAVAPAGQYAPAGQTVVCVFPVPEQYEPAGHFKQAVLAVPPVFELYFPAAHNVGAVAPAGQYAPAGQTVICVLPVPEQYEPAGHFVQTDCPVCPL